MKNLIMKCINERYISFLKLYVFIILFLTHCFAKEENFTISMIKPFRLPGVDGQYYTNENLKGHKYTLIIFLSNHCRVSQSFQQKIIQK